MVIVVCSELSPILHSYLVSSIILCKMSTSYTESCSSSVAVLSLYVLDVLNLSHLSDTQIHTCILNIAPIAGCLAPFSWSLLMNRRS